MIGVCCRRCCGLAAGACRCCLLSLVLSLIVVAVDGGVAVAGCCWRG